MRSILLFLLVLSFAGVASAQDAENDGAAPAQDPGDDGSASSPSAEKPPEAQGPHLRWAAHVGGGPWILPGSTGGFGGVGLQLGVQINELVGVYYSGFAGVGGGASVDENSASASAGGIVQNAVMADVTLLDIFQVGAGPSLDYLGMALANGNSNGTASASAAAGVYFGLNARAGLALGGSGPGARGRFMVGLEVHPTFVGSGLVPTTVLITLGGGHF